MDIFEMRRRVTEGDLGVLVDRFYERVRDDRLLGPVFASRIGQDDWPAHLAKMRSFWSTILLGTGGYSGDPMGVHRSLPGIARVHFKTWLALFQIVVRELFEQDVADAILRRAHRMGDSLSASMQLA
jgi:hemoglobin